MSAASTPATPSTEPAASRRDFLFITTAAVAAVGVAGTIWPLIDQMNPDARTIAAGGPIEIDVSALQPGQQIVASWQSHPIFVLKRSPAAVARLSDPALLARLSDPDSVVLQQPDYARNPTRSANPEIGVYVGVCTHLGCVPGLVSAPNPTTPAADWPGGYFCPCHGSKYDLAGRVFKGVPAPYNLPAPPYHFANEKVLRIGENPAGAAFDFSSIVQM